MRFSNPFRRKQITALSLSNIVSGSPSVTPDNALAISAVYSAVSILARTTASLPFHLYQDQNGVKRRATDHPLDRLLRVAPNKWMSPADYIEALMSALLLQGNAYSRIVRSQVDGSVTSLIPIHPSRVEFDWTDDHTDLLYKVKGFDRPLKSDEIWHIRGLTTDGINGLTPITVAREAFQLSQQADIAAQASFKNAARPSGILTADGYIKPEQAEQWAADWQKKHSGQGTGTVAVFGSGVKYTPLALSVDDQAWIIARKFSRSEIAALFHVPQHMLGDLGRATWSNISHMGMEFVDYSLRPWLVKIEQSFLKDVLLPSEQADGYFLRANADALMRGDALTRVQVAALEINNGLSSPNEVRAREDRNPRTDPGGDAYLTPLNMASSTQDILSIGKQSNETSEQQSY